MNEPDNDDYPLYRQRPRHKDDTVLGTCGLLLLIMVGIAVVRAMGGA